MTPVMIKSKVLQELDLIPEDKLVDLYNFIHYFRLGLEKAHAQKSSEILAFVGSWQDMPDEIFADFTAEITERRSQREGASEDDRFDYRLEHDERFLRRVSQARDSLRAGRGIKLEEIDFEGED